MNWLIKMFSSSIGQKVLMALTGLFLCLFLVVHLTGNFQLLMNDDGFQFNKYAKFMTSNPLIKVAGYITYLTILLHAFKGLWLAAKNNKARSVKYKKSAGSANSTWMSRSMGLLGTIILVFIVIHMQQFWYQYKFGKSVETEEYTTYVQKDTDVPMAISKTKIDEIEKELSEVFEKYREGQDREGLEADPGFIKYKPLMDDLEYSGSLKKTDKVKVKNLYAVVKETYKEPWYVVLYVVSMLAIAFHLLHGFNSAFQTMGWKHSKYNGLIKTVGVLYSILIPAAFAAIPLIMYFR